MSQVCLAKLMVENNGVTFVENQKAFIVNGNKNKNYEVTLFPKETCQCPATGTCYMYHILSARIKIGNNISEPKKIINLKQLSKNNFKRNDKKSGRKKPRPNDYDKDIIPAPDSVAAMENEVSEEPIKPIKKKLSWK